MEAYKDHSLTFRFINDGKFNEIAVAKSLFSKLNKKSSAPGFIKEYNSDEIELIRGIYEVVDRET